MSLCQSHGLARTYVVDVGAISHCRHIGNQGTYAYESAKPIYPSSYLVWTHYCVTRNSSRHKNKCQIH